MSSAQRKRFLRALARNPEDSIDAKPSREEPSAPSEPAKPVVEPVKGVRFDFDTLSRFQGIHGMGLSPVSEEVNFRKRPNYDGSRRRHMRLQRARTSHTENGLSRARVEGLIRRDCCRCQRKICFAKYRQNMVDQLLKFLKIFWSLARAAQDSFVLFVAGDKANCRRSWYVLGKQVLDPRVAADSTTVLETASRSIDFALQLCDELRVPRPNQLLVWADNCVRENKNGQLLRFLSWLYQIYGLIATAMKYIDILSDGLDVAAKIENVLNRIGVRHWIGQKARIRVQYISGVREFKNWLSAAPVTFAGGLKTDETGLHAFIFMRRSDLPANINIVAHGRGAAYETHESDVILMVKRNASDDGLCQEPMLAFPYRYVARFGPLPAEPRSLKLIKPAKKKDYLALAQILLRTNPSEATRRAVEFLVGICTGLDPEAVPTIKWLEEEPRAPAIDLGGLSVLDRVAPAMRLRAHLRP
ncbi:unnamed protein product [Durusdinium trenchii]|uniref:Uncharacterized protein n=1 Tax=Durusdinium trenchii TaxID=1381693 RepID=A0ABP0I4T5_9DINO